MRSDTPPYGREDRGLDEEAKEDERRFPYSVVPYGGLPTWPTWRTEPEEDRTLETDEAYADDEEEGTWLDEGLISLLLIAGVVLVVIPEPATSGLGILLVAFGVILWVADWLLTES